MKRARSRWPARIWTRLERFGAWGALDRIIVAGSGFIVATVVARLGGPEELGVFALVQGITLLLAGLLKAAFADPVVIEAHRDDRLEGLAVALPLIFLHLAVGVVAVMGWSLIGGRLTSVPAPTLGGLALTLLLPFASFTELARSFRLARMDERGLFTGDLGVALARVATLALGFRLPGVWTGLAALAAGGIVSVFTIRHDLRRPGRLRQLPRLWQLGRWFVGESFLYSLTTYGIWALVVPRAGTGVAGQLRAAQQLFIPVQTIVVGLNTVLLARLARLHGGSGWTLEALQVGITGIWGAILIGLGSEIPSLLFGSAFHLSRWDATIFSFALMASVLFDLSALRLRASGIVRPLIVARIGTSVVALGGAALIGSSFSGVATSMLASQLVGVHLLGRARSKQTEISSHDRQEQPCNDRG